MKKTLLIIVLCFATLYSIAQCEKVATYFSGEAKYINTAGKVVRNAERENNI
jgi:hypothetical protein